MTEFKCAVCGEPATWMRYTQFAGNHPFCDKHAELETDFGSDDADWEKLMPFGGYNPLDDGEYEDFSPWFKPEVKENKMTEVDLTKIQLVWTQDILVRIKTILDSKGWTEDQKLVSIAWLVKQGLKKDED